MTPTRTGSAVRDQYIQQRGVGRFDSSPGAFTAEVGFALAAYRAPDSVRSPPELMPLRALPEVLLLRALVLLRQKLLRVHNTVGAGTKRVSC